MSEASLTRAAGKRLLVTTREIQAPRAILLKNQGKSEKTSGKKQRRTREHSPEAFADVRFCLCWRAKTRRGGSGRVAQF
jgi:hypothetical protein